MAVSALQTQSDRCAVRSDRRRAGVRHVRGVRRRRRRTRRRTFRSATGSPSRSSEVLAAITPRPARVFLTNPNNPTGGLIARDDIAAIAAAAPQALVFVDEAYADFSGRDADWRLRLLPHYQRRRRPDVREGLRAGRAARRGAGRRRRDVLAPLRRTVPPYTLNVGAAVALPAALEDTDYFEWYVAQVRESKRAALRRAASGLASPTGRAPPTSCWRASAPISARSIDGLAARGDRHPRSVAGSGVRRLRAHHDRRGRTHASAASPRSRRSCAARRNQPGHHRDVDRAEAGSGRARPLRRQHRHPVPRSHAGARRPARRLRLDARGQRATSTSISITPSRTSASRSARRCRWRSATAAASIAPATS